MTTRPVVLYEGPDKITLIPAEFWYIIREEVLSGFIVDHIKAHIEGPIGDPLMIGVLNANNQSS